jgi:hypothetical protein
MLLQQLLNSTDTPGTDHVFDDEFHHPAKFIYPKLKQYFLKMIDDGIIKRNANGNIERECKTQRHGYI